MSKVKKGIKKGFRKVSNVVKKHWRTIALVGVAAFTGGLAIGGWDAFRSAVGTGGLWSTIGSTMWAGVTGTAGTFGIGSGASGAFAAGAGMQGATLMTGAGAQALGLASSGIGGAGAAANVGTYTGPGSSFMGGGGSLFGGAAGAPPTMSPVPGLTSSTQGPVVAGGHNLTPGIAPAVTSSSPASALAPAAAGGMGWKGAAAAAAVPALINAGGAYMMAKGEEEAAKPRALWGYDLEGGTGYEGWQPQMAQQRQTVTGPDGQQYEPDGMGGWRPAMGLQPIGLMELQGGLV